MTGLGFTMPAPDIIWSTNQENVHWSVIARRRKAWRDATTWHARHALLRARRQGLEPQRGHLWPGTVRIGLSFATQRRRDPHNYVGTVCKAVVDGLVIAGYWPDDTPEWVHLPEPSMPHWPGQPGIIVNIQPMENP